MKNEIKDVAIAESEETQSVAAYIGHKFDLTGSIANLPNLNDATEMPLDLASEYWTPVQPGEFKRVFFDRIEKAKVLSAYEGEPVLIDLECAFFIEQLVDGQMKSIRNGSKLLVNAIIANGVQRGTALKISFMGKKKNRQGPYSSDSWSIKPLIINI